MITVWISTAWRPQISYRCLCFLLLVTYSVHMPDLCSSFGLMQRMYDGSLFIRISISWLRLFLNCVAAVFGRFFVVTSLAGNTSCWKEHNRTEKQNYFHAMICGYRMSLSSGSMILLLHLILALNLTGVTNITHETYGSTYYSYCCFTLYFWRICYLTADSKSIKFAAYNLRIMRCHHVL